MSWAPSSSARTARARSSGSTMARTGRCRVGFARAHAGDDAEAVETLGVNGNDGEIRRAGAGFVAEHVTRCSTPSAAWMRLIWCGVVIDHQHVAGEDAMLIDGIGAHFLADDAEAAAVGFARAQFVDDDFQREQALHARHQLHFIDRLGEELFRAGLQAAHAVVAVVQRGEDDDRDVARFRHAP